MRDSPSVHSQHSLNARLLRFRSQPHSEDAYALVEDLIDAGRHADARSVIALAKPEDREDALLLLMEGRAHLLERDLIRAQAALLSAVKAEPSLQQAYRYLGEVLLKRGDPVRARKTLRRALALDSSDDGARELLERAEYLVEAANDSLEALPSPRDSEFDVDAQAEQQAAEFVDQLPSEPAMDRRVAPAPAAMPQPPAAASRERRPREDEPTSQVRNGRGKGTQDEDLAPQRSDRGAAARRAEATTRDVSEAVIDQERDEAGLTFEGRPGAAEGSREPAPSKRGERSEAGPAERRREGGRGAEPRPPERRPLGAFEPAAPAARKGAREAEGGAWDSEPAAPHPEARRGAAPAEPKRNPPLPPPAAAGRAAPRRAEVGLPPSPRGAWSQGAMAEDSEPAASHAAAVAGRSKQAPALGQAGIKSLIDEALQPEAEELSAQPRVKRGLQPPAAFDAGGDAEGSAAEGGASRAASRIGGAGTASRSAGEAASRAAGAGAKVPASREYERGPTAADSRAGGAGRAPRSAADAAASRAAKAAPSHEYERAAFVADASADFPGSLSREDEALDAEGGAFSATGSAEDAAERAGRAANAGAKREYARNPAAAQSGAGRSSDPAADGGARRSSVPVSERRSGRASEPEDVRAGSKRPSAAAGSSVGRSSRPASDMRSGRASEPADVRADYPSEPPAYGDAGRSSRRGADQRAFDADSASAGEGWAFAGAARRSSVPAAEGGARSSLPAAGGARSTPPPLPRSHAPQPSERGKRLSHFRTPKEDAAAQAGVTFAAESGAETGPADPEQVLALVQQLGLFEDPSAQPAAWLERGAVEHQGQRVRGALLWLWGVSLLLCAAGYFGWNQLVERRHEAAASMVAQARVLMSLGDHAALVDAERLLRMAREQHPASLAIPEEALFVQLQRVLEDGERDTAALRSTYARAQASQVKGPSLALASLLLSAAGADSAGRDRALAQVLSEAKGDARTLYLLGRAEERMGLDAAAAHFEAAAAADAKLIPAQLALAERAYERGERAAAMRGLDAAVAAAPNQLRVRLFRMLVAADDVEPDKLRQDLNGLAEPLRKGNSIDQALAALVRARLARRSAAPAAAQQAIDAAAASGVDDARVLGWLAEEALAIGNSMLAQQLASRALSLAPERARSRRLLARILVERGAGQQAFVLLSSLPAADAEVQVWRARAALLSNDPELLRAALAALPPAPSGKKSDSDVQRAALRLRIETQLDPSKAVLDRARSLAHAAPTDPDALLALAEAALAMRDAKAAQTALKQRALLLPEDVQAQTLLGRSLRMGGDVEAAEAAFRRALSLRPGYVEAQAALAALLLDRGQFEAADAVYRELALRDETALSGRLGRVEALLGQAKLADAQVQLEAAPEAERGTAAYREVAAKLALTRGEVAQALKLLGPLSEELPKRASLRTLYAEALLAAAQLSAATDQIDAALALDPELPEALLGRAELQLRANKTKDALATLSKAESALRERVRPPTLTARRLSLLGRTLLERKKRGDAAAAVRALREASEQPGAAADSFFFLGEALSADKDKAGAQNAYRRYLELAPNGAYRQRAQRMLGAPR